MVCRNPYATTFKVEDKMRESYEDYMKRRLREEEDDRKRRAEYEDREWQRLTQLAEAKKKIAESRSHHDIVEPKIYESPDGGKTVYERDFRAPISTRKLVMSPEEQKIKDYLKKDKPFIQYGKDEHEVMISAEDIDKINNSNKVDMVNHPPHYNKGIETTDYIDSWEMGFSQGNVVKYVTRYNLKHDTKEKQLEDLKKCRWYLEKLIHKVENEERD